MLANIFTNRLFVGALAIFIFCVGGSLLYMQHVTQQGEKELAETQARVSQWNEKQKPITAETPVVEQPTEGGHFHADGTFHAGSHETATEKNITSLKTEDYNNFEGKLMHELTPNERSRIWEQAYRENVGGDPPPGYLQGVEQEFQNILKSVDEPRVHIVTIRGFAPNKEQLERYFELREQFREAHGRGAGTEADFFKSEMERLEVEAEGDVPLVRVSWQSEKAKSIAKQVLKERTEQAYRDFGLEHLLEHGISGLNTIKPTISE